jgi:SRSO17 transposase
MKPIKHTTSQGVKTTINDVVRWAAELRLVHARIAPHFARSEPRHRSLLYMQGIVSDVVRKNGWQLAEQAGETRPDGMQRLLTNAVWDHDRVRDELRKYVLQRLGDPNAILALDETCFPKEGEKSAGVAPQYCGRTKRVENCQVGVFLSYISHLGHTLLDRELYLPQRWIEDRARCREAGIPDTVRFQTKCELAQRMMERIHEARVPVQWVVADTVYGNNLDLRTWLEDHGYHYGLAVACTEQIGVQTPTGRKLLTVAEAEQLLIRKQDWQRKSVKTGLKGPLFFDWACLPILHKWEDDQQHWLLVRRIPSKPTEKTYYLIYGPVGTILHEMARAISARWGIEEDFENGNEIGLDHYEVRSFVGWYRHVTLVMIVLAVLTAICVKERTSSQTGKSNHASPPIALAVPEVRRLLARLIFPLCRTACAVLDWSDFRRCHQGMASASHTKRRLDSS